MISEAPFLQCRQCGIRYRSDKVTEHDNLCSQVLSLQEPGTGPKTNNERATLSNLHEKGNKIRDRSGSYASSSNTNETEAITLSVVKDQAGQDSSRHLVTESQTHPGRVDIQIKDSDEKQTSHDVDPNTSLENESNKDSNGGKKSHNNIDASGGSTKETDIPSSNGGNKSDLVDNKSGNSDDVKRMEDNPYPSVSNGNQEEDPLEEPDATKEDDGGLAELLNDQNLLKNQQEEFKKRRDSRKQSYSPPFQNFRQNHFELNRSSSHEEFLEKLPVLSPQAEKAYHQHRKSLVPCKHCDRKFVPDRLQIHERSCMKRPKTRKYITPDKKA